MIKRSMLVCAAVLLVWHLVMPRLSRSYYTVPGMQRANYNRAQIFVHDSPADAKVIVGSSMSDRLDEVKLGADHVKLTFPGGGPFTGLELIRGVGRRPPVVWIETNVILRDAEADLLADALAAWRRGLREASPVFKEEGRPSAYGVGFLKAAVAKACKVTSSLTGKPASAEPALDGAVFENIMKENRAHLDRKPSEADLAERAGRLGAFVDELSRDGVRCVLYEMPIDASLADLAEPAAVRKAVKERFPTGKYQWLELRRDTPWETTDGIHLKPNEADQVVAKMLELEKGLK